MHAGRLLENVAPTVAAPVLVQVWRGGSRQANVARLLRSCEVEDLGEDQARGDGLASIVDVTVVEGAIRPGDVVVTSDPKHITRLAGALRRKIRVVTPS